MLTSNLVGDSADVGTVLAVGYGIYRIRWCNNKPIKRRLNMGPIRTVHRRKNGNFT